MNESIPKAASSSLQNQKKLAIECPEKHVRIDRTSQLLLAMSITIADFVKQYYLRATTTKAADKE